MISLYIANDECGCESAIVNAEEMPLIKSTRYDNIDIVTSSVRMNSISNYFANLSDEEKRGFDMELQFSSGVVHCYEIALKGATTQKVSLGEDANGNITRIDNAIGRLSEHIENTKVELKNIQTQYETAQIEVQKPFAQEEELKAKTKRQIEVEKLISSGATDEQKQEDIPDCYYFPATDEQINALTNASVSFEKQTKSDGSIIIRGKRR